MTAFDQIIIALPRPCETGAVHIWVPAGMGWGAVAGGDLRVFTPSLTEETGDIRARTRARSGGRPWGTGSTADAENRAARGGSREIANRLGNCGQSSGIFGSESLV